MLIKQKLLQTGLLASTLVASFLLVPQSFADADKTIIRGNVYNESNGGKGIGGLTVTVSCAGKHTNLTQTATTDGNGLYTVHFSGEKCQEHKPVTSTVTFQSQTQSETVLVSEQDTATLDFYFGSANVPEFNPLTAIAAVVASAAGFILLKKKSII